jgi:3-phosphoglycerate kinase
MLKTIHNFNLKNKKVFLRVGFDVPLGDDGKINEKEDWRIKASLPTIKYLLKENCKIILAVHLGRPKGKIIEKLSVKPIQKKLSEILNLPIIMASDCVGLQAEKAVDKMQNGEILLLENLRFHQEEKKNDLDFAKKLASLAEIYINDAFSVSHRRHASVCAITKFLPSYAGLLLEKEVKILSKATKNPKHPAIAIIGGAKIKTKMPAIQSLAKKYDQILVGGLTAVKARIKNLKFDKNVFLPDDFLKKNGENLDIGKKTIDKFQKIISAARTIVWNGPMGKFEEEKYSFGTKKIAETVAESGAYKIVGGGDTIFALGRFGLIDKMDFVSTGGGSMLEFLSGKKLPGLEALQCE